MNRSCGGLPYLNGALFDPPEPEALPPQAKGMSIGLFIDGPQGQLRCERQGANGTPILLVHGILVDHGGDVRFAEAVMALQDFDAPFALGAYPGPKLHIHSVFLETQHLAPIHAQVPAIESILVQDCSHWVHLDQPEVFDVLLEQFVARL